MTQPPLDPAGRLPASDPAPTEAVPPLAPPAPAAAPPPASSQATPPVQAGAAWTSSTAPDEAWLPPGAPPVRPRGRRGGGPGIPVLALGAVVVVASLGLAFAAGRLSAPDPASVADRQEVAAGPGTGPAGQDDGRLRPGDEGARGGALPDAPFGIGGDGARPGTDDDRGFPGRGVGRAGLGGLGLTGTVTEVTADSMTVELDSGLTVTVGLDGSTTYHQQAPASSSDVTAGDTVQVQVSGGLRPGRGTDGSIDLGTAADVTIVP